MAGGVLQLESTGIQDKVFIESPQINLFKSVFKRYHNFAFQEIEQTIKGVINFGNVLEIPISKKGDLISKMCFNFKLPALSIPSGSTYIGWTNNIASVLVKEAELFIGNQKIDKLYSVWCEIWDELTTSENHKTSQFSMLGKFETATELQTNATSETEYFFYLPFWFHHNIALSIPIVSLQYHEISVRLTLRPFSELVTFDGSTAPSDVNITSAKFFAEYIFLEDTLRSQFAKNLHVYLINQIQSSNKQSVPTTGTSPIDFRTSLDFNHRVKALYWVLVESDSEDNNDWLNFSKRSDTSHLINKARIVLDGQERESQRNEKYFRLTHPVNFHSHSSNKFIYMYSFSRFPENIQQPSGALNFSQFDSIYLELEIRENNPSTFLYTFALSENFLIIQNGMSALAFLT